MILPFLLLAAGAGLIWSYVKKEPGTALVKRGDGPDPTPAPVVVTRVSKTRPPLHPDERPPPRRPPPLYEAPREPGPRWRAHDEAHRAPPIPPRREAPHHAPPPRREAPHHAGPQKPTRDNPMPTRPNPAWPYKKSVVSLGNDPHIAQLTYRVVLRGQNRLLIWSYFNRDGVAVMEGTINLKPIQAAVARRLRVVHLNSGQVPMHPTLGFIPLIMPIALSLAKEKAVQDFFKSSAKTVLQAARKGNPKAKRELRAVHERADKGDPKALTQEVYIRQAEAEMSGYRQPAGY